MSEKQKHIYEAKGYLTYSSERPPTKRPRPTVSQDQTRPVKDKK